MPVDPLLQGLLAGFLVEAQELSQKITRDLLELERGVSGADEPALARGYENVARNLHTLKGSAATLGLDDCSLIAHKMEDVVAPLRRSLAPFPATTMDEILKALDVVLGRIRAHAEGTGDGLPSVTEVMAGLLRFAADAGAPDEDGAFAEPDEPATRPPLPAMAAGTPAASDGRRERSPEADAFEVADDQQASWRVSTTQIVGLMREVERLREARLRIDERRREVERALAKLAKLAIIPETAEIRAGLMGSHRALAADGEEIADVVDALEQGVKEICTLPVRTILDPLHRAVRDLCRTTGKECRLSIVGAEVSLDRRVLELLRGPMVHLVRNAVDHGIELPQEREKRGKHREGILVIRVEQQGNMVFLEVGDDGGGLDLRRIKEVAQERGVATPEELAQMDAGRIHQLVFRPGFSTKSTVTETSGRGVGLDVVRERVQALHGHIEVQSTYGQGSRFILTLPTELGSSQVLVVRCGEQQFGLPMLAVESVIAARKQRIRVGRTQMKIEHGEHLLPLIDLGHLLGLRQAEVPADGQPVLVIQAQGERLALTADEVIGDRELVIRPLPPEVRDVPAYQGASTLARGDLLLVLRSDWLVKLHHESETPLASTRRALVVDDSLTARALHRAMLEAGGYTVYAVGSAKQALDQLKKSSYDVMVSDIGMAEMDGLALTTAIRQRAETRSLPVILVSAHDTGEDRERGLNAGADGFLSKKDCASGRLLAEVSQVIARRRGHA